MPSLADRDFFKLAVIFYGLSAIYAVFLWRKGFRSDNRITYFARTNFRGERKLFGIKRADRRAHMYIIGKTGTGKSTLLETMIRQDIKNSEGFALLDPQN